MSDSFEVLELLLLVVDTGSLSAAAREVRVPLATISRKIASLESRLGANLLLRGQRRVSLTDAGRSYVDAIRPLLEQLREAEQAGSGEFRAPTGELSITAAALFGRRHVIPLLHDFLHAHDSISARVLLTDRHVNLREEGVDVAIRMGAVTDPSLTAVNVGTVRRVICASADYLAKRGRPRRPEEVEAHDAVVFDGHATARRWELVLPDGTVIVEPHHRIAVNDTEAAVQGAIAGFGLVRVFSYQVNEALRDGMLIEVLSEFSPPPSPIRIVYANREPLPRKIRSFVDWLRPRLKGRLSSGASADHKD